MSNVERALEDVEAGDLAPRVGRFGLGLGIVGLALGVGLGFAGGAESRAQFWYAYLVAFFFVLSIGMGTLFFTMVHHLVNAHWSVTVRRLAELTMANVPVLFLFGLPLLYPLLSEDATLWRWADTAAHGGEHGAGHAAEHGEEAGSHGEQAGAHADDQAIGEKLAHEEHGEFVEHKRPYLNVGFFMVRLAIYFLVWWFMTRLFFRGSIRQDSAEGVEPTLRMKRWSAPMVILFALTLSFASFDLLMSLDETWFSTIFGVVIFAGCFVANFAWLIICAKFLQSKGLMKEAVTKEHYHDLGKFMFAFIFFWGYVSFSQFMLIWYANIPEETHWYANRFSPAWIDWSWALLIVHFLIPFPALLSRHVKRNTNVLLFWAIWMMGAHWLDLYWYVMPNLASSPEAVDNPFGLMDVSLTVGMVGILIFLVARKAAAHPLVPKRDPLLEESLAFHNF